MASSPVGVKKEEFGAWNVEHANIMTNQQMPEMNPAEVI